MLVFVDSSDVGKGEGFGGRGSTPFPVTRSGATPIPSHVRGWEQSDSEESTAKI